MFSLPPTVVNTSVQWQKPYFSSISNSQSFPCWTSRSLGPINAKRSRHVVKHVSNSTHPVIFGIGTVECIVAVIRGSWSDLLLSISFNYCLKKKRQLHSVVWPREEARIREGKRGRCLFLIPGLCGESSRRGREMRMQVSEQLPPAQEGRKSFR